MNFTSSEKIASAILYEGYILYPYRSTAIKNRQRWNFGTLYPRVYAEAQRPHEPFRFQAEFLIVPGPGATLDLKLSFLQLLRRQGSAETKLTDPSLDWEEAVERSSEHLGLNLNEIIVSPLNLRLQPGTTQPEAVNDPTPSLEVLLDVSAEVLPCGACKLHLELQNVSPLLSGSHARRDEALPQSLVSAHMLLGITGGEFVSLLEPPPHYSDAVAACTNTGIFPVLAGEEPRRDILFCSPIILYDYPKIAPESEGDFFDGTEMDEMLTLRVLTLTDAEKDEMRNGDPRARRILERTEALTGEEMLKAHGIVRHMRELRSELRKEATDAIGSWNPFAEEKAPPESVRIWTAQGCVDLRVGDRVRICPTKAADIMDLALTGKIAVIEAIEQDFEDQIQLAVVLDDDPGREFGMMRQPGHRFFFGAQEIEPYREEASS